jgi:Tol biopolymer transport system component
MLFFSILLLLVSFTSIFALEVKSVDKFMDNAVFDAWNPDTNDVLFLRKDEKGILQIFKVKEDSKNPETEKICISCNPQRAVGFQLAMISATHKGSSDWHPSGEWFITQGEIPDNVSWKLEKRMPGTRLLAEPGAGWWNNLFLARKDGSVWIKLTNFTPNDLNSGVLYPKFSRDGKMIAWAERIGGTKPFDQYPFARWVLKTAKINIESENAKLYDIKLHPPQDGAIFEPQGWSQENKLLFAADIGYAELPYPGYRIDIWEADIEHDGTMKNMKNLTKSKGFYEEQASYSPDGKLIAFMANNFDTHYEKRMNDAWKKDRKRFSHFIVRNLTTDLYIMHRVSKVQKRLTRFAEQDWQGKHPLVTRSAWSKDGKTILLGLTLRSNVTGKKEEEMIYRIRLD